MGGSERPLGFLVYSTTLGVSRLGEQSSTCVSVFLTVQDMRKIVSSNLASSSDVALSEGVTAMTGMHSSSTVSVTSVSVTVEAVESSSPCSPSLDIFL